MARRLTNRDPLPRGVVRDLLAICRALYRAELSETADALQPRRLARLDEIGHMLRQALELSRVPPDTIGHRAAWSWADKGASALGEYVAAHDVALGPVLRASVEKMFGAAVGE